MLLQPYAENAVKHGLLHSTRPEKWVRLTVQEATNGDVEILITDNGIGRQASALLQQSNGLQHQSLGTQITLERMELFSQQHHCRLTAQMEDLTADGEATGTLVRIIYQTTPHV
jgi:sensor histidine kinase YesM